MRIYVCLASNVYELVGVKPAAAAVGGEIRDTHTKAATNRFLSERRYRGKLKWKLQSGVIITSPSRTKRCPHY